MDQHAGGKWLIQGTTRLKDNQLQNHDTLDNSSALNRTDWEDLIGA